MIFIPVIDDLAWLAIRLIALIQAKVVELISRYYQPDNFNDQIKFMGYIYGGYFIAGSRKEDVPRVVAEKMLPFGRLVLIMLVISILFRVLRSFVI